MKKSYYQRNEQILKQLIAEAGIADLQELSKVAGVSQLQLIRLSRGLIEKMQLETLLKIAIGLKMPLNDLLVRFLPDGSFGEPATEVENLKQEYRRLEGEVERQKAELKLKFEYGSIQKLESWLLQWPVAAAAAKNNSQLSASKILPLVKPVENLIREWGVEAIGAVGETTTYDPKVHQLIEGAAEPGAAVKIRYLGYRHRDRLLYRAKVSPLNNSN